MLIKPIPRKEKALRERLGELYGHLSGGKFDEEGKESSFNQVDFYPYVYVPFSMSLA